MEIDLCFRGVEFELSSRPLVFYLCVHYLYIVPYYLIRVTWNSNVSPIKPLCQTKVARLILYFGWSCSSSIYLSIGVFGDSFVYIRSDMSFILWCCIHMFRLFCFVLVHVSEETGQVCCGVFVLVFILPPECTPPSMFSRTLVQGYGCLICLYLKK